MKKLEEKIVEILDTNAKYTSVEKLTKEIKLLAVHFAINHKPSHDADDLLNQFDQFIKKRYEL